MRNKFLWCALVMTTALACRNGQQQPPAGYTIEGTLKGIDSGIIKLEYYDEATRASKPIDSGIVKDHQFKLTGRIGVPRMVTAVIAPGGWHFSLFLEDTAISVTADTTGSRYFDYTAYKGEKGAIMDSVTVTGSASQHDWEAYQKDPGQTRFNPVFAALNKEYEAQVAKHDKDGEYKVRDRMDSVRQLLRTYQRSKIDAYITQHPGSVAGIYMFQQFYISSGDFPAGELDTMLHRFTGEAAASVYYPPLAADLAKKKALLPGSVAPDFTLLKRDSTKFTLSSLRGNYTMIDFWASWCYPCRQAIPHWKKVYAKYHDKGFNMVSVSDDARWADWFKAMDVEKMPWQQVCDEFPVRNMPAKVGSLYMTTYIPFYVLLDKDGKILVYSGKEEDIDNKLKEVFGS